jgi:hypothetical protein
MNQCWAYLFLLPVHRLRLVEHLRLVRLLVDLGA